MARLQILCITKLVFLVYFNFISYIVFKNKNRNLRNRQYVKNEGVDRCLKAEPSVCSP